MASSTDLEGFKAALVSKTQKYLEIHTGADYLQSVLQKEA